MVLPCPSLSVDVKEQAFYLHVPEQPLCGFAGIYSTWMDLAGTEHGVCAVMTIDTEATDDMTPSKLPIIVDKEDESDWLNPAINDLSTLFRIMRPLAPGALEIYPVSDAIDSKKAQSPNLIERLIR